MILCFVGYLPSATKLLGSLSVCLLHFIFFEKERESKKTNLVFSLPPPLLLLCTLSLSLLFKCAKCAVYAALRCRRGTTINTSLLPSISGSHFLLFHFSSFFLTTWSKNTCQKRNLYACRCKKNKSFFFDLLK